MFFLTGKVYNEVNNEICELAAMSFNAPIDRVIYDYLESRLHDEGKTWQDMADKNYLSRVELWRQLRGKYSGQVERFKAVVGDLRLTDFEVESLNKLLTLLEHPKIAVSNESDCQALLAAFVLLIGKVEAANRYLEFYKPTNRFHQSFTKLLNAMDPRFRFSAIETMVAVARRNRYDFSDSATARKRFVVFYATAIGDEASQRKVLRSSERDPVPQVQLARFIGPMLGRHGHVAVQATNEWLRWSSINEMPRLTDVQHTLNYYGSLAATMDGILEDLSDNGLAALWPSCMNTALNHLTLDSEGSTHWLMTHARRDCERLDRIHRNLAGPYQFDHAVLRSTHEALVGEAKKSSSDLASLLSA